MIERFLNRILGALFMWLFTMLAGCTVTFQVVTKPDPATMQWIADTTTFNQAVKTEVDSHEQRIRQLEAKETP